MLIRRLILENFGLFRGRNEIDLSPRIRYGRRRPVILIGGKNGSGKTTLLEAIRLCLYGSAAVGIRGGGRKYEEYLGERIHRVHGALFQPESAAVGIEFEYAQAGRRHTYTVERSWDRLESSVPSKLVVLRDGKPLDELDQAHADDFLRDLIPPGVSELFFFDGEKIQQLAETEHDELALADAVRGLLGIEIIERLRTDLRTYAARLKQSPRSTSIQAELSALVDERASLEERRRNAVAQLDQSRSRLDQIRKDVVRQEHRLARAGGSFAGQRQKLKAEREQLQQSIKDAEAAIRELGEGLLPFTLAAGLCQAFHEQLRAEGALQRWLAHESLIEGRVNALKADVESTLFPAKDSSKLPKGARGKMIQRVKGLMDQLLEKPPDMPVVELIHRVSEEDRSRLLGAIERVFRELPRQLSTQQRRLERNIRRLRDVEKSLEKIPTDEVLKPVLDEIRDLHRELGTTQIDVERGELLVKEIDLLIIDLDRRERKVQDRLREAEKIHGRIALAAKVQAVLEDYAASLTSAKTTDLRDGIARCFTQLWRKGDLVRRIDIDPADFTVSLFDAQDRVMPKKELSAGEKQIYAISLLWALAQASGRPLPIVIDTPLGRLDSEHRSQLVRRYFPQASHQVVIFSTDTEIDRAYFRELGPAISHAYQLRFDPSEARCVLEEGYFWGADEREVGHAG